MQFHLWQIIAFVVLCAIACLCVIQLPIVSWLVLVSLLGASYFFLSFSIWKWISCGAFIGIGSYIYIYSAIVRVLALPLPRPRGKGGSPYEEFINSYELFLAATAIPIGALLGLVATSWLIKWCQRRREPIPFVHRFIVYLAIAAAAYSGVHVAYKHSVWDSYTWGRMRLFSLKSAPFFERNSLRVHSLNRRPIESYPRNPDRFFALHVSDSQIGISYPLLITSISLIAGALGFFIYRHWNIHRGSTETIQYQQPTTGPQSVEGE
jgi:hypothetical protein